MSARAKSPPPRERSELAARAKRGCGSTDGPRAKRGVQTEIRLRRIGLSARAAGVPAAGELVLGRGDDLRLGAVGPLPRQVRQRAAQFAQRATDRDAEHTL